MKEGLGGYDSDEGVYVVGLARVGEVGFEGVSEDVKMSDDVFGFCASTEEVEDGLGGVVMRFCYRKNGSDYHRSNVGMSVGKHTRIFIHKVRSGRL